MAEKPQPEEQPEQNEPEEKPSLPTQTGHIELSLDDLSTPVGSSNPPAETPPVEASPAETPPVEPTATSPEIILAAESPVAEPAAEPAAELPPDPTESSPNIVLPTGPAPEAAAEPAAVESAPDPTASSPDIVLPTDPEPAPEPAAAGSVPEPAAVEPAPEPASEPAVEPAAEPTPEPTPEPPPQAAEEISPPGFRQELAAAGSLLKAKLPVFVAIAVVGAALLLGGMSLWMMGAKFLMPKALQGQWWLLLLYPIVGIPLIMAPMVWAGTAFLVALDPKLEAVPAAYLKALPRLPGVLLLWILLTLFVNGAFMLLIVPGVMLSIWFLFAWFILVEEGKSPIDSLVQSRECVRGRFFSVMGKFGAASLLVALLTAIPAGVSIFIPFVGKFIFMMIVFLGGMFFMAFQYILYKSLRSRPEVVSVDALSRGAKLKTLSLGIVGALLLVGVNVLTVGKQVAAMKSKMQGMGKMSALMGKAMAGDKSAEQQMQIQLQAMQKRMQGIDISTPQGQQEAARRMQAIMQAPAPAPAKPAPKAAPTPKVAAQPAPAVEEQVVKNAELPEIPEEEEGPSAWEKKAEDVRETCVNELGMFCTRAKLFNVQIACLKKERAGLLRGCRRKLVKYGYLK